MTLPIATEWPRIALVAGHLDEWRRHRRATGTGSLYAHYTAVGLDWETVEALADDVADCMGRRHPDQRILRCEALYLERWHVERTDARCVYLHRFRSSDPDVGPHDHPWDSASLLLAGRQEERWRPAGDAGTDATAALASGALTYRTAAHAHRLLPLGDGEEAPVTLFVTGRRRHAWGFWVDGPGGRVRLRYPDPLLLGAGP